MKEGSKISFMYAACWECSFACSLTSLGLEYTAVLDNGWMTNSITSRNSARRIRTREGMRTVYATLESR